MEYFSGSIIKVKGIRINTTAQIDKASIGCTCMFIHMFTITGPRADPKQPMHYINPVQSDCIFGGKH